MTSEPDSKSGRRPPTIELKATEVDQPAAPPQSGGAAPGGGPAQPSANPNGSDSKPGGGSAVHARSHAVSAVIGAAIVAAIVAGAWLAGYLPPHRTALSPGAAASNSAAIDAIVARLNDIQGELRAQPRTQQSDAATAAHIAATDAKTKSLDDSLAALNRRLDEIAAASQSAAKAAAAAQAAAETAQSASQGANQSASQAATQTAAQKRDLDALASRIAALESAVKGLSQTAAHPAPTSAAADRAARSTVVAEALRATVERGAPYQAELAAVQALGVAPNATAPLQSFAATGIPSAAALGRELADLTPALQRATETESGDTGFLDRLEAHAQHLVRITPVDAPAGNEPSAVVARIEADADRADIAAALNDIAALPDAAKPLAADWAAKAKAREAAIAASRQIAAAALAGLSKPASQ